MKHLPLLGMLALLWVLPVAADEPQKAGAPDAKNTAAEQRTDENSSAPPYCVSQTGSHVFNKDGSCLDQAYGVAVTRHDWEQRGGFGTADYLTRGVQ